MTKVYDGNRPLFHGVEKPPSFIEYDYTKVIVTSSLSKAWGMQGVRSGWMVCRNRGIMDWILNAREYTLQATSVIDEVIAAEALSTRCRNAILQRHLDNAQKGLQLLDAFVEKNSDVCSWTRPTAGATAFIRFINQNGEVVDDNDFCRQLLEGPGLLVTPGSLGFSNDDEHKDFRGYVRIQFTLDPSYLQKGLEMLDTFLQQRRRNCK